MSLHNSEEAFDERDPVVTMTPRARATGSVLVGLYVSIHLALKALMGAPSMSTLVVLAIAIGFGTGVGIAVYYLLARSIWNAYSPKAVLIAIVFFLFLTLLFI